MALHRERLDQRRAGLQAELVQPSRLLAPRSLHGERLARAVQGSKGGSLYGGYAQASLLLPPARPDAQLTALLDQDHDRTAVEQREPAIGHQAQQPQL